MYNNVNPLSRNDIQTLSSMFEQRLTVLVAKLKKNDDDELIALKRLGLKTDHMLKIEKVIFAR